MIRNIILYFVIIFSFIALINNSTALAGNNIWNQTDWTGGADQTQPARHPGDQSGWTKFFSKDPYINTSVQGEISISPQPGSRTETSDIGEFDTGTMNNVRLIGTGTSFSARYEQTHSSIVYTGTWTTTSDSRHSNGSMTYSRTAGATATLTFTGNKVTWLGLKGRELGIAAVYLDGQFQGNVDLYNNGYLFQQVLFSISGLSNTAHTLRIETTGNKNPSATAFYISVDAFDVEGVDPDEGAYLTLVDDTHAWVQTSDVVDFDTGILTNVVSEGLGTSSPVAYQENNAAVTTTGTWTSGSDSRHSGGFHKYSRTIGGTATLTFTAREVTWLGLKGRELGIAGVYLDGQFQGNVDLYNNGYLFQQVLFSISGLSYKTHTLMIKVTGSKNPSATDVYVSIDAFNSISYNPDPGAYLRLADGFTQGVYESESLNIGFDGFYPIVLSWSADVPAGSSLRFQFASNDDNQTWNFIGPDGTPNTFYEISSSALYSGHGGHHYIRYRAYFDRPTVGDASPILNDVTITYGSTAGVYESSSFDLAPGGVFFDTLSWTATVPPVPPGSGVKFQIAANNDNQTWNFTGPDGALDTYYITPGPIHSGLNGNRYIKYRAILTRPSTDPAGNPRLEDVTVYYEAYPSIQILTGSPFDTTDETNGINRMKWSESLPTGTDSVIQLRTSPDGNIWASWYGPHASTFTSSKGVSQVTVADVTGFYAGARITLTDSANPAQMEINTITAINATTRVISLNSTTAYAYAAGSILTDSYTDPAGMEFIYPTQRSGNDDRWIQYRLFLFTVNGTVTPVFLENQIGYLSTNAIFQPDGIVDGIGDNVYGASGAGGTVTKVIDPGYKTLQSTYDIRIQNDGNFLSGDDSYTITWNTPSDALGAWTVYLNDGTSDLTPPQLVHFNLLEEKVYTLKVRPTLYSPGGTSRDITINMRSENDLAKTDSIKATAVVRSIFEADAIIDNNGDNVYDPSRTGGGGAVLKKGNPGDITSSSIRLQNEGNVTDTYRLSLVNPPPTGWTVLINDGSKDYDITNPSNGLTTPAVPAQPASGYQVSYIVKVIPRGAPVTADLILNIFSIGGQTNPDSVKIQYTLLRGFKVDGIIYNFGYNGSGEITDYGVQGSGCGSSTSGDNVYGSPGSGSGGCTARDTTGGTAREISVGVQNEGNIEDRYRLSWNIPTDWTVVMQERLNDGSITEYSTSPVDIPTAVLGNPAIYNPGELPFFTFRITPPSGFTSGSQTITFDIESLGDASKTDSVKAVINSSDTTPPAAVNLFVGAATATSLGVSWLSPGDDGNSGTAASYDLRYSTSPITADNFAAASKVRSCKAGGSDLARPKPAGGAEACVVQQLYADTNYYFALKTFDDAGNESPLSSCPSCPARTLTSGDTTRPGQITDLSVMSATKDTLTLCWTAPADNGTDLSSGLATEYDVRYSTRRIVDDGITQGVGEVTFSNALTAQVVDGTAPPRQVGAKECYLVTVANDIDTGGGIIDNRIWNTRFYFAVKTLDEARNKSLLSNIAGGQTVLKPYAYNMVSVPYVPNPSSPQDVFGDDTGAQLSVYWWDSRGPNPDSGCYDGEPVPYSSDPNKYTCTRLTNISEGNGYFLWVPPGNVTLDVPSSSTVSPVQDCVDDVGLTFQCYVYPLQEGWNMFGTPFDREINFTTRDISGNTERGIYVRGTRGSTVKISTFQMAVTAERWIEGSIYTYNGINYTYEVCDQDVSGEPLGTQCSLVMQPWKAYWARMLGSARFDTFELLIPY